MSRPASRSLYQIRMEGWAALTERLGAAGAMQFMMQYDPGHGDYSKERHEIFDDLSLDALLAVMAAPSREEPHSGEPGSSR